MPESATARAQAGHRKLDQLVIQAKRAERALKEAIRIARQVQAELIGIEVETTQPGGTVGNQDEDEARADPD